MGLKINITKCFLLTEGFPPRTCQQVTSRGWFSVWLLGAAFEGFDFVCNNYSDSDAFNLINLPIFLVVWLPRFCFSSF